jgi:RND family efflux transporter MFP subunit
MRVAAIACVLLGLGLVVSASAEPVEGLVKPSRQVTLGAPLDAIVAEVPVEESQAVTADQVVARMDDELQKVRLASAELQASSEAAVREAELVLAEAQIMLDRAEQAAASDAASEWEVRRAKLQRDQSAAGLDDTRDRLAVARVNVELERELLRKYTLRAPFDGVVLRRHAEAGATLQRGGEIVTLVALDPLEAEFYVPTSFFGALTVGQPVTVGLDADIARWFERSAVDGTIKTIDPVSDPASRTFRVVVTIPNPDGLPAGFSAFLDPRAATNVAER